MMMILMMMVIANDYVDEDICRRKAEFPGLPSLAFHPLSGDIYTGLTQRQKYFYRSDPMAVCQILTKLKVGRLTLIFSHPNLSFSVCSPLGRRGGRTRQICFSTHPPKVFGPTKYSHTKKLWVVLVITSRIPVIWYLDLPSFQYSHQKPLLNTCNIHHLTTWL